MDQASALKPLRVRVILRALVCVAAVMGMAPDSRAAGESLQKYELKDYVLHTDLPAADVREAGLRLTRTAELYRQRMETIGAKVEGRLPVFLYSDVADYERAGGAKGSAGVFDGRKLIVLAIRRTDGQLAMATWRVLQHEGFHQYARAAIGREIPMWAGEGLAEYFAEAIFTGDGSVSGVVPQDRLERVRRLLKAADRPPLKDFLELSREDWNRRLDGSNYDLAWSVAQFLAHGGSGKQREGLAAFTRDIGGGVEAGEAFAKHFGPADDVEKSWRAYWLALPDQPTADRYARATVAMLTSFLARAHVRGDRFESFERFVAAPAQKLEFAGEDWLPASLWRRAVEEVRAMGREGAAFKLVESEEGRPMIEAELRGGVRVAGWFAIEDGKIVEVATRLETR
jgi:Protein of unknown function (DUF1570)